MVLVDILAMNALLEENPSKPKQMELYTLTIPDDEGNGISVIFQGKRTTPAPSTNILLDDHPYYEYSMFDLYRKEIANLVTWPELKSVIDKKAAQKKVSRES